MTPILITSILLSWLNLNPPEKPMYVMADAPTSVRVGQTPISRGRLLCLADRLRGLILPVNSIPEWVIIEVAPYQRADSHDFRPSEPPPRWFTDTRLMTFRVINQQGEFYGYDLTTYSTVQRLGYWEPHPSVEYLVRNKPRQRLRR